MAIPASFTVARDQAYAGMIADTSLYNVDGTCAANPAVTTPIKVGVAVSVLSVQPIEGHKVVDVAKADTVPYGVTVMSHAYSPKGEYEPGCATNVLSHGRIWIVSDDATAPVFGHYVKIVPGTGHAAAAGTLSTEWQYTGEFLKLKDGSYIAKIQVLQSSKPVV